MPAVVVMAFLAPVPSVSVTLCGTRSSSASPASGIAVLGEVDIWIGWACTPSPTDCQQITLTKGDIEFFDMQSGTAGVVQYQLELRNIKATTTTAAKAQTANARESKAGRDVIRQIAYWTPMYGVAEVARAPLTHELPWYAIVNAVAWLGVFVVGAAWRMSKDTARV